MEFIVVGFFISRRSRFEDNIGLPVDSPRLKVRERKKGLLYGFTKIMSVDKVPLNFRRKNMQLIQRNNAGFAAQVLPAIDNQITTGAMGDCVSIVVLYNRNPATGRYADAMGYHGGGGLGNVNFVSLFAGVPNAATTLIIVVSGTLQGSFFAIQNNRDTARQEANLNGLNNALVRCYHARPHGTDLIIRECKLNKKCFSIEYFCKDKRHILNFLLALYLKLEAVFKRKFLDYIKEITLNLTNSIYSYRPQLNP